jgi:asparagine synthase (glutamine-hydrolysing)
MQGVIAHRGPDASGSYSKQGVGLCHRRLSIIDLSDSANQPMFSQSGNSVAVYNGEIYNYDYLRRELGIAPKTSSDTEIAIELIEKNGSLAFGQFSGMFAIALYSIDSKKLTLARDQIGIKPLYYYWDGAEFAFASEIKSLMQLAYIKEKASVNTSAAMDFLHLGYIPAPQSIYNNIYKLEPGCYAVYDGKSLDIARYWHPKAEIGRRFTGSQHQAKETLRDLVEDSVRSQLRSDVPFGSFLSGGIDSSLVAAAAQRNLGSKLKTFTISFADAKHDESRFAKQIADYLGTEHTEFRVTEKEVAAAVPFLADVYDEPFADSSAFPTMAVSKLAKQHVSMVLSGDGGDELFHGYGAYKWASRLSSFPLNNTRRAAAAIIGLGNSRMKRVSSLLKNTGCADWHSHIFSQEQCLFSQEEVRSLVHRDYSKIFGDWGSFTDFELSHAEKQAAFDFCKYLPDDLLVKVDRASMQSSLEVRVPLLDVEIAKFAFSLPQEMKTQKGEQKYLLKQVLYEYIPAHLFDRPKWGFSIPLMRWLKTDLSFLIDQYLNTQLISVHGIVCPQQVAKLVKRFRSGKEDYLYNRIWALIVLHQFLEKP